MIHHETVSGLLNPIREVGASAHKYDAFFITDTTSSYAMIPIDVYKDNICFERTKQMHFKPPVQVIYAALQGVKEYESYGSYT